MCNRKIMKARRRHVNGGLVTKALTECQSTGKNDDELYTSLALAGEKE